MGKLEDVTPDMAASGVEGAALGDATFDITVDGTTATISTTNPSPLTEARLALGTATATVTIEPGLTYYREPIPFKQSIRISVPAVLMKVTSP